MYKIIVHVKNEKILFDPKICIEINLPFIPKRGDFILLNDSLIAELEDKAFKYDHYRIPKWRPDNNTFSFFTLEYVDRVGYIADTDEIHIDMNCYTKSYGR